jgi:microcystin-dependent protein
MADPITRIVFRRGLEAERSSLTLLQGEPGYATNSKRLYIGDGVTAGGVPVGIKNLGVVTFGPVVSNLTVTQASLAPAVGDIVFDTTSSFIYALTASDYTLVSSFTKYGAAALPDEVTITDDNGSLAVKTGSLDATYLQSVAIGRGLERVSGDQTVRIADPGPELTFSGNTLYISPAGVTNEKLAVMQASTVKARLGTAGLPQDVPFTDFAAAIKPALTNALQIAGIPVGTILDFASDTAPDGYLTCDGSAVSRSTYSALFTIIGTKWGVGNGTTTFNLPDLRRRVTVGSGGTGTAVLGNLITNIGGAETHTLTVDQIPSHTHVVPRNNSTPGSIDSYGATESGGNTPNTRPYNTLATGGGLPHSIMQPTVVVNKIIKY